MRWEAVGKGYKRTFTPAEIAEVERLRWEMRTRLGCSEIACGCAGRSIACQKPWWDNDQWREIMRRPQIARIEEVAPVPASIAIAEER